MSAQEKLTCFKSYDVRGKLFDELNEDISYRIGRSSAHLFNAKSVAVGFDARETSPRLAEALTRGILDAGVDVLGIGLAGTEEIYVSTFNADAGIEVTASHNPIDYNGMKLLNKARDLYLIKSFKLKNLATKKYFPRSEGTGLFIDKRADARDIYIEKILGFVDLKI